LKFSKTAKLPVKGFIRDKSNGLSQIHCLKLVFDFCNEVVFCCSQIKMCFLICDSLQNRKLLEGFSGIFWVAEIF